MSQEHGTPGGQPPPYAPAPPGFGGPPPAPGGYAPAPPYAPAPAASQYHAPYQPPYGAPGGPGPRRSRTGLVVGLVAGGIALAVAAVVLISVLDSDPEVAAPTMPSLDMTEIIDVLNPVEVGGTTAATAVEPATSTPITTAPGTTVPGTVPASEATTPPVDGSGLIDLGGGYSLSPPGPGFEIFTQEPGFLGMRTPTGGEVDIAVDPSYGQADAALNVEAELRAAFDGAASEFSVVGTPEPLEVGVGTSAAALDFTATLISAEGGGLPTLGVGILVVKGDGAALLVVAQTPNADFQAFLDTDVATVLDGIRF